MYKKENLKYTLDRLYECRNIEITNLWQRSVFLSVFLILCFSAYGFLASQLIDKFTNEKRDIEAELLISLICVFISMVGMIFSIIWIYMGKGSKAWYEVYERAISKFEKKYKKKLKIPKKYIMGKMKLKKTKKENKIFSTKAGGFSPSKINIAIGQISFILWCLFTVIHVTFNLIFSEKFDIYSILTMLIIFIFSIVLVYIIFFYEHIKSSFL